MSSPSEWLASAFLRDGRAKQNDSIQGHQFLRTGVKPTVGQRVELTMIPKNTQGKRPTVFLSGHVVKVQPEPDDYFPMECMEDRNGSMILSQMIGQAHNHYNALPEGMKLYRCTCSDPECIGALATIPRELAAPKCPSIVEIAVRALGAIHNQEVVCEGRLHFAHDMRRGDPEGPTWADGIPFDGRDVWQFTVMFNDHMENKWILKPNSFRNLGRNCRPRCWPWSNEEDLPYDYLGMDSDDINQDYPVHACIGPFGCNGEDHSHTNGGAAA